MRAKFNVSSIKTGEYGQDVTLFAVYGGSTNAEDNQFAKATPSGKLDMHIDNPKVFDFFKEGESYYLDFTKATNPQ